MGTDETLVDRLEQAKANLATLQAEVEDLGHFFGAFHAVNGLRQAQTFVSDTLYYVRKREG